MIFWGFLVKELLQAQFFIWLRFPVLLKNLFPVKNEKIMSPIFFVFTTEVEKALKKKMALDETN